MPALRYADSLLPTALSVAYAVIGWACGIVLMALEPWALNALGVVLTAHALVISAYLIHDCTHGAIFQSARDNDRLGMALAWLNGACIAPYAGIKEKHLRHHADRLDVVTFDYRAVLSNGPAWIRRAVLALEWAYIPAVELVMRALVAAQPFSDGTKRDQATLVAVLAIRIAGFAALAAVSVKAVLLYALAYMVFIHVLRFMDAFQHTFDVYPTKLYHAAPPELRRDRQYEYENTYSNLVSLRWPWLNLLVLNFPYHNAHHAKPVVPWFKLPEVHRELYGREDDAQAIPCSALIASYHKHRVARVLAQDYGTVAKDGDRAAGFLGAVGVSFLTAV